MSVLSSGQIDGFVKLCTPDIILGYTKGSRFHTNLVGTNEEEDGDKEEIMRRISIMEPERRRQARSNTMLRVFATTEPYACFPKKGRTEYSSNETAFVLTRVKQWAQSHLNFGAMVHCCPVLWPDNRGVSWLATRFLTEQNPPNGFDTLTSCAHYVSLIPSLDEWRALTKATKKDAMVLTSQQCINIHAGNREERSALLANFFMHLSKKSPVEHGADVFLAIGLGVPEGATVSPRA